MLHQGIGEQPMSRETWPVAFSTRVGSTTTRISIRNAVTAWGVHDRPDAGFAEIRLSWTKQTPQFVEQLAILSDGVG